MENHLKEHRKTLPVVKVEPESDEENLAKRVLPILSPPPPKEDVQMDPPVTAVPTWLRVSVEEETQQQDFHRMRHSFGLDVPGAVQTIPNKSKYKVVVVG